MSGFSYSLPDEEKFFLGLLKHLQVKGHDNLVRYLKGGRLSFEDSGIFSQKFESGGRWDAYGLYVKFHVNPDYIQYLDTSENRQLFISLCDSLIDAKCGYDIKNVEFITDIEGNYDLEEDLFDDLNAKTTELSKKIINELLPEDLKEKGYYMSEVYTYLYCIENTLRLFIEKVCVAVYGDDYFSELSINKQAREKISSRKELNRNNKWISLRGNSELFYLDFTELGMIIENNWAIFKKYFPNDKGQQWILSKINDLSDIRNLVAHNSFVGKQEKDLLKSYYNIILKQIDGNF
jgi:hypothetical protein